MRLFKKIIITCVLCVLSITMLRAQDVVIATPVDSITVSLITCYPGPEVFEVYGHTAIRVKQGSNDMVFNYGMFSFAEPNFVYRFVKGDADYCLAIYPFQNFLPTYKERGSKIVEQVINFSQAKNQELLNLLLINAEPENKDYRYNYVYDNCSTRPRDLIEKVAGGSISYPQAQDTITFRQEMARYNVNYPWLQFGIDMALGSGLDYDLSYREQMFVPMILMHGFAGATYDDSGVKPLISETFVLNDGTETGSVLDATPWYMTPMTVALALLIITLAITIYDIKRNKVTKIFDTLLYTLFGGAGCVVFFLVFISIHAATSPNLLAFWLNPFCFLFAILIWIKVAKKLLLLLHFTNFATLFILLVAWYWLPQAANLAFFPLIGCSILRSFNYIIIYKQCAKEGR